MTEVPGSVKNADAQGGLPGRPRKRLELGVFLPVARNGFVFSANSTAYEPTYRENLAITRLAEEIGLDYVFSMAKWRGFGGSVEMWDASLESFSLMAALAAATRRIRLIATVNPLLLHPAAAAKMTATVDDVSDGRIGLNIITGGFIEEYAQMGIVPLDYNRRRYEYAEEWVTVLKRIWTEDSVDFDGEFFHLTDCVSRPKPVQRPYPSLVCAGTSDEGLRFTVRHADYSFVTGGNVADTKQLALRVKEIASQEGQLVKTAVGLNVVSGPTKAAAESYAAYLGNGADLEALVNMGGLQRGQGRETARQRAEARMKEQRFYFGVPLIGGPGEVSEAIADLAGEGQVDSVLLMFPDFIEGLHRFRADVMPLLAEHLQIGQPGA